MNPNPPVQLCTLYDVHGNTGSLFAVGTADSCTVWRVEGEYSAVPCSSLATVLCYTDITGTIPYTDPVQVLYYIYI